MSFRKVKQEDFLFKILTAVTLIVNKKNFLSTFFGSFPPIGPIHHRLLSDE